MPLAQVLARIGPNSPMRVATPAGILDAQLLRVASDSVYILVRESYLAMPVGVAAVDIRGMPLAAVDTLWIRGGGAREGAMIGAVAGAVGLPLLFLGGMVAGVFPCDGCGLAIGPLLVLIVPPSAVLGALAGVGVANERWRRIYP